MWGQAVAISDVDVVNLFICYMKRCELNKAADFFKIEEAHARKCVPIEHVDEEIFCYDILHSTNIRPNSSMTMEHFFDNELLSEAVSQLNRKEKELLFLKFYKDKTDNEISTIFEISRQAVSKMGKKTFNKILKYMKI